MGRSRSRSGSKPRDGAGGKREKGTINTWNNDRQFGFVSCDSGRQDLFTHAEYITDTNARYDAKTRGLRRGDRISFEVEEPQGNKKSQQAVNVEILELMKRSRSPSRRRSRSPRRSRSGGGGRGGGGRGGGGGGRPPSRPMQRAGDRDFARRDDSRRRDRRDSRARDSRARGPRQRSARKGSRSRSFRKASRSSRR
ncbi:unnamed protein product [Symbiodinium sp. CCMP2456]|nr:unnamed protein product [Symbiodinium sp. CCMP2456]